ncbi:MAG: hypothetical protein RLZZ627_387 [Pseudomonadota bacterium]
MAQKPVSRPQKPAPKPKAAKPVATRRPARKGAAKASPRFSQPLLFLVIETLALMVSGLIGTISVLGRAAGWFGGSDLTQSLLPFAGTVLILGILSSLLLAGWLLYRRKIKGWAANGPVLSALVTLIFSMAYAGFPGFQADLSRLRSLVGGAEQAGRDSIAHQVYAAYRRANHEDMALILSRVKPYEADIHAAAKRYSVDPEVLVGIGVAESSFLPRDSKDGGRGLFQITAVPKRISKEVAQQLSMDKPDPQNPRDNIYLAAATFHHYLGEMKGDLFLGLLAYNIGPRNGGLASIMAQYGARDFFTIQPYLKDLPRDYPIRVLSAALAYRLMRHEGGLPPYHEGENAKAIQALGIPGLDVWSPELLPTGTVPKVK